MSKKHSPAMFESVVDLLKSRFVRIDRNPGNALGVECYDDSALVVKSHANPGTFAVPCRAQQLIGIPFFISSAPAPPEGWG